MPVIIGDKKFVLSQSEVDKLWQEVMKECHYPDELVTLQAVDEEEIKRLNKRYRRVDKQTNILTFSYGDGEHDVVVCLAVAKREADRRKVSLRAYVVLLVTHALLHVAGMDHEASEEDARVMSEREERIVEIIGLAADHL